MRRNSQAQFRYSNEIHPENESGENCLCGLEFRFSYAFPAAYLLESAPGAELVNTGYAAIQNVRVKIL
jgi:hypothetical protein